MRLGRERTEEIFDLIPILNRYPLKEVIIHPRTGVQMYTGTPDLDTFEKCLRLCRFPVIYNGDIQTRADFERLQARFPILDNWMIGRGVVSDPFLPASIKGMLPESIDYVTHFRRFHDTLFARYAKVRYGPAQLADAMKGYWNYFAESFHSGERILKQVHKTTRADQYSAIVNRFFDQEARWKSEARVTAAA